MRLGRVIRIQFRQASARIDAPFSIEREIKATASLQREDLPTERSQPLMLSD
jgi:hypothetical protein